MFNIIIYYKKNLTLNLIRYSHIGVNKNYFIFELFNFKFINKVLKLNVI